MPGQEIKQPARLQIPSLLARRFMQDYNTMLAAYTPFEQLELTNHLLQMMEQLNLYAPERDEQYYYAYYKQEDALLQKYGSRFQAYYAQQFYQYFALDLVLAEKEIYTDEQYNDLPEQAITPGEVRGFVAICRNILHRYRAQLYLQDAGKEPQTALPSDSADKQTGDAPDKDINKARQLLAIYYLLKASFGIEARDSNAVSAVARLIHLLTGTKFTTIQNSDIYKKYLRMPNYKKDGQLIADLKFIRPYFEDLAIGSALKLVDEELARAIKELPYGEREKYKEHNGQ